MPRFSASWAKISRRTTSSLAMACISGVTCWPARCACCSSNSTRDFGTDLPLTCVMFWAPAAKGSSKVAATATADMRTAKVLRIMGCLAFSRGLDGLAPGMGGWRESLLRIGLCQAN